MGSHGGLGVACLGFDALFHIVGQPWAVWPIVRSLMALQPIGYMRPRRPPVPKGMVVQKASSNSGHFSRRDAQPLGGHDRRRYGWVSQMRMLAVADTDNLPAGGRRHPIERVRRS